MLKWKINTEQKKEVIPTRSKNVLDFFNNNLSLLHAELLQETEKCMQDGVCEDGAIKVVQWRTEAIKNEKRTKC